MTPQAIVSRLLLTTCVLGSLFGTSFATDAFLTEPDIHGNKVVFTAEGDLWLADITTGDAFRITSDPGVETSAHFSPDGSQIAFTANYDGGSDVYVIPTVGGSPKRLTYDTSDPELPGAVTIGWTPDGRNVLFTSSSKLYAPRFEQQMTQQLFEAPIGGGMPKLLAVPRATFAALKGDGHSLAFVPSSITMMNWFRYQGGTADQIWLADLNSGKFKRLTTTVGVETQPVWVGDNLYFVSERSGVKNLWKLDPVTLSVTQITFSRDLPVRHPASDGRKVVFQLGPGLEVFDPAVGKLTPLNIRLHSDRIHARPFEAPVSKATTAGIGPGGQRVALVVRGHLVTVPTNEGVMRTLVADSAQRVQNPSWSPDGKLIAYISDQPGEEQLFLIADQDGAKPKQLTFVLTGEHGTPYWSPDGKHILLGNRAGDIQLIDVQTGTSKTIAHSLGENSSSSIQDDSCFSPDSKTIAYSVSLGERLATVFLYDVASGKTMRVSDPEIDSSSPTFSLDGRYLYMLQGRSLSQKWNFMSERMNHEISYRVTGFVLSKDDIPPFTDENDEEATPPKPEMRSNRIDWDGLADRYFDAKVPTGSYLALSAVPGRLVIQSGNSLLAVDTDSGKLTTLTTDGMIVSESFDGRHLLVKQGDGFQAIDPTGGPITGNSGQLKLDGLTVTIDPEKEWRQMFEESWRVARDFFYDPNMHGVNWNAIRRKYEAQIPLIASRYDLTLLTRDMISELNVGHAFAGAESEFASKPARPGLLGADLQWDEAAGAYRIAKILRGDTWKPESRSPFAEPGIHVKEGDYLLRIQGELLRKNQDPEALLLGAAGHKIRVTVNSSPGLEGSRDLVVTPMASDSDLRLKDWIRTKKEYVDRASNGQIAYIYLSNLGDEGSNQFAEHYYPNVDRPGIIIDVRGNDGGNISGNLLDDLNGHITGSFAYRAGGNYRREKWAPLGHVVAIANEFSFSDADYFSEFFKRLKIGPLVGHRTLGGNVGSNWYRLVDGGGVGIPNYGAWVPGEWVVEGRGAIPDYEVDNDPASLIAGRDLQLEKAIDVLMQTLRDHPFKIPAHPPYPIKTGGSRG